MHIDPFWDEFYKKLEYTTEHFKDPVQISHWNSCGHSLEKMTIDVHQITYNDFFTQKVKSYFPNLMHIGLSIHRLSPGNYLPIHQDKYGFYSKKHNVVDLNNIQRYIMFLEDSVPGHMLIIKEDCFIKWKSGDIKSWQGEEPHSAINLGMQDRYTLQITGIVNGV